MKGTRAPETIGNLEMKWKINLIYFLIGTISNSRTRTKDKYRVVYSDTQRLELEKEFAFNKYITIQWVTLKVLK